MMELFKGSVTGRDWAAVGVILGITLVLAAVFVLFVQKGQQEELATIMAENEVVLSDLKIAQEKNANIQQLREEAQKTQTLVSQFEERLPLTREIPLLVKQFESMANDVSLHIVLTQLPPEKDARKETIPYSVVARGNFHQIASFINRLERFTRYLKISDLKIGSEKEGVCEAKFTLSTFRFIQSKESSVGATS